jgi:hypothetical protein
MVPPLEPGDPRIDDLAEIDEILQVMYWLRGERLAQAVSAADLSRWIGLSVHAVGPLLARMAVAGWVQAVAGEAGAMPRYELTATGVREGGRRFADEFANLTRPGHGECADPDCECQRTGDPADCSHRHV